MSGKTTLLAQLIAEFLGTFVLILFGRGVVAMVVLFPTKTARRDCSRWVYQYHHRLGTRGHHGHLRRRENFRRPPESRCHLGSAVFRGLPWQQVLPYSIAQTAGAFLAAAVVYKNYLPAFHQVDPMWKRPPGYFTTFPAFPGMPQAGFLDQMIGTGLLLLLIFAITDEFNTPPGSNLLP